MLLPALTSVTATSQSLQILADGAGSKIDLSGLTSVASGNVSDLSVTNQATVLDPKLTSLTDMSVTIDGTGTMAVGQWTTLTTTSVEVTGGTTTLSGVTSVTLPNNESMVLQASGSGATLSLPALTGLGQLTNNLYLEANQGGQLLLPALTSITPASQDIQILADGSGSQIDFPALTSMDAASNVSFAVTNQATVDLTKLASLTGTLNLTAGTLTLPGLTSAGGVTIDVTGGSTLILPAPTAFTATGSTVSVTGAGSSIQIGGGILDPLPASGNQGTITVPQFPQGMTVDLNPDGTFSGGTTFNVGADATVNIQSGTYTGGVTFNVGQGAVVDLTGGNTVTYGGTLTGSGAGTVQLSGGNFYPATGGATLDFSAGMFQWTGGGMELTVGEM